jgi:mRNA interferase MazF
MMKQINADVKPRFGEIWMCQLKGEGSIQNGYRPVFVLSNDKNNAFSTTLNVIPLTSKMNKRRLPIHVELWDYKRYGLRTPSTLMTEQTTTIKVDSLDHRIGVIGDNQTLARIKVALSIQFAVFAYV